MDTQWSDYGDDEYFFGIINDQKINWGHGKRLFAFYRRLRFSVFTRLVLPHILLVLFIVIYCLLGAYVFYILERPSEIAAKEIGKSRLDSELNDTLMFIRRFVDEKNRFLPKCNDRATVVKNSSSTNSQSNVEHLAPVKERIIDLLRTYRRLSDTYHVDINDLHNTKIGRKSNEHWSYASSILFAFTVITTIGYGNLAPVTFYGRLFCILYGLIGIPATMVAIANVGQFLAEGVQLVFKAVTVHAKSLLQRKKTSSSVDKTSALDIGNTEDDAEMPNTLFGAFGVCSAFVGYVLIGAVCLPIWEDFDFFGGCYFAFVTITTIGLGDIVPEKLDFLFPTVVYITLGLAVTTLTIEVMSQYLRQVHYAGSRVKDSKNAYVWFGNRMLTVGELVTLIGDRYGIPKREINDLKQHFDSVVVQAVDDKEAKKRAAKTPHTKPLDEIPKGRAPLFDDAEFRFIDEESLFDLPATIV